MTPEEILRTLRALQENDSEVDDSDSVKISESDEDFVPREESSDCDSTTIGETRAERLQTDKFALALKSGMNL